MPDLSLVLATAENGLMDRVIAAWDKQVEGKRVPASAMHALKSYEGQLKPSASYGVFILCKPGGGKGAAPYEALVHINHAFPKTPKPTLRLVWHRLAPKYEWATDPIAEHGRIFAGIIGGALTMSQSEKKSGEVKFYLPNHVDRTYGKTLAASLSRMPGLSFVAAMKGAWLHFEWI